MSIIINGMEMPTSCDDCPLGGSLCCHLLPGVPALWEEYTNAVREKRRHSDCPLVPVPPHGRLIDADDIEHISIEWELGDIARIIAPTIIPADKET